MVKRSDAITAKSAQAARVHSGIEQMHPERLETLETEVHDAIVRQSRDGLMFATLRWALGITEDIDPDNLELDT
mgnify:CR=1 FL=1